MLDFLFQCFSGDLVKSFTSLISDLRTEGVVLVLKVIEQVFCCFPGDGPRMFAPMLPGFLQYVLNQDVRRHFLTLEYFLLIYICVLISGGVCVWGYFHWFQFTHLKMPHFVGCEKSSDHTISIFANFIY